MAEDGLIKMKKNLSITHCLFIFFDDGRIGVKKSETKTIQISRSGYRQ